MIKSAFLSPYEVPVILVIFKRISNFRDGFSKNNQTLNVIKPRTVTADLFNAVEQMDRHDKGNCHFFNFYERP